MIAVIGSNMIDLVTFINRMPNPGETLEAREFFMGNGGKGCNQAVAAALMSAKTYMITSVGDDIFADNTINNLQNRGIDTKYVKRVTGVSSGVAPIFVDRSSQNSILINKGANNYCLPEDIDAAAEDIKKCAMILLQLEIPLKTVYYAIEFGKQNNIPVLLNPAPATKELDIEKVCDCAFFAPNETELAILTDMPVNTNEEVLAAARSLTARGLKNVLITLGSRGSMWVTNENCVFVPSIKVEAVDTTGAGDSYLGSFAALYVESNDVVAAMKGATAYAALGVQNKGTQTSYPTRERYEKFVRSLEEAER